MTAIDIFGVDDTILMKWRHILIDEGPLEF
jgi:hypothetical protein